MSDQKPTLLPHILCRQFLLDEITPEMSVLDVGCGNGDLMVALAQQGCVVRGIEIDPALVLACRERGLDVTPGRAEEIPLPDNCVDAIVCSVVIPYTDPFRASAEWARVVRPNGVINATYHGIGYGLDYLFSPCSWMRRFYGFRMLVNTAVYTISRRRLPGFMGDTLCQLHSQMGRYYQQVGMTLSSESVAGWRYCFPQFLCHRVIKAQGESAATARR